MSAEQSKINLPTELISEKTFYTLGGASAGVLLVCWVVNYVAVDVSWLTYKIYRLIGLFLSEGFAILIMLKKKEKQSMKWLFAVLNGFLIFVNASGLNVMTSSYIFNPKDSTKTVTYFQFQKFRSDKTLQAGIFPLPRMISWWPDEKLIAENIVLTKKNETLVESNQKLKSIIDTDAGIGNEKLKLQTQTDSLIGIISGLRVQLTEKQTELETCISNGSSQGTTLNQQLNECIRRKKSASDSLDVCQSQYKACTDRYEKLKNTAEGWAKEKQSLQAQLAECKNQIAGFNQTISSLNEQIKSLSRRNTSLSLTEHISQACNSRVMIKRSPNYQKTQDDYLKEQPFWKSFCASFNSWNSVIK